MKFTTRNKHSLKTDQNVATFNIEGFSTLALTWQLIQSGLYQYTFEISKIDFADKDEPEQFKLFLLCLYALHCGHLPLHVASAFEIDLNEVARLADNGFMNFAGELAGNVDVTGEGWVQLKGGLVFRTGFNIAQIAELDYKSEDEE